MARDLSLDGRKTAFKNVSAFHAMFGEETGLTTVFPENPRTLGQVGRTHSTVAEEHDLRAAEMDPHILLAMSAFEPISRFDASASVVELRRAGCRKATTNNKALPMHMIPTGKPAGRFVDLPRGPQLLAATLWGGSASPETIRQRAVAWMKAIARPVRDVTVAMEAIAWAEGLPLLDENPRIGGLAGAGRVLVELAGRRRSADVEGPAPAPSTPGGRTGLDVGYALDPDPVSRRLERSGRAAISLGLSQILDRQGMLPAEHFRMPPPVVGLLDPLPGVGRGVAVAAWVLGPNNGTSGSCGMPCGVLVLMAGRCWRGYDLGKSGGKLSDAGFLGT